MELGCSWRGGRCWVKGDAGRLKSEFVPCRGLTLPNNPGGNQKPPAGRAGRKGGYEIREGSPGWEGGQKLRLKGWEWKTRVVHWTNIWNEDPRCCAEPRAELGPSDLQVALRSRAAARLHSPLTREGGGPWEMCAFIQ